jgi:hypothetical protein
MAKVGDFTRRLMEAKAADERHRLAQIAAANAEFWSKPENQGRS